MNNLGRDGAGLGLGDGVVTGAIGGAGLGLGVGAEGEGSPGRNNFGLAGVCSVGLFASVGDSPGRNNFGPFRGLSSPDGGLSSGFVDIKILVHKVLLY